jgi:hypothetical protein
MARQRSTARTAEWLYWSLAPPTYEQIVSRPLVGRLHVVVDRLSCCLG